MAWFVLIQVNWMQGMGDFLNEMATMMSQNQSNVSLCPMLVLKVIIVYSAFFHVKQKWFSPTLCTAYHDVTQL